MSDYTLEDMMIIAAARRFKDGSVCFTGVGQPSVAACVAREVHAPHITLVYESGAIGSKPSRPPLSIADFDLAASAKFIVSVPEIFSYWLQGGRIDMGFLGAAQIDRIGNINSTVIGGYDSPKVRLPGGGGAPQIAAHAKEIVVIARHNAKTFVEHVDFITTARANNPITVVTDFGILEASTPADELMLTMRHPGVDSAQIRESTGWPLKVSQDLRETAPPAPNELEALRRFR
jgi:glutaconate CoA-transferase subunit B